MPIRFLCALLKNDKFHIVGINMKNTCGEAKHALSEFLSVGIKRMSVGNLQKDPCYHGRKNSLNSHEGGAD